MKLEIIRDPSPLEVGEDGTICVRGSDVPFSGIITAYESGKSAKAIRRLHPSLDLADVYDAIGYYLRRKGKGEIVPPIERDSMPIRFNEFGVPRIGNSRVGWESIIVGHRRERTPERLAEDFDTLELPDIYAALAYYLRHRREVIAYMRYLDSEAEEFRREHPHLFPSEERLRRQLIRHEAGRREKHASVAD